MPTGPVIVAEQLPDTTTRRKKIALDFRAALPEGQQRAHHRRVLGLFLRRLAGVRRRRRARDGTRASPARRSSAPRCATRSSSTKEVVGTHGVYNFKPGEPLRRGRARAVIVKLDNGPWKYEP